MNSPQYFVNVNTRKIITFEGGWNEIISLGGLRKALGENYNVFFNYEACKEGMITENMSYDALVKRAKAYKIFFVENVFDENMREAVYDLSEEHWMQVHNLALEKQSFSHPRI